MLVVWPEYICIIIIIIIYILAGASVATFAYTYVLNGVYRAHGLHMHVYGILHFLVIWVLYYFQAIKFFMKMLLTACITYKHHDACAFSSINEHHLLHFMCFTYK